MLVPVVLYDEVVAPYLRCAPHQVWALRTSDVRRAGVDTEFVRSFYRSAAARCYILRQWLESRRHMFFVFLARPAVQWCCPPFFLVFSRSRRGLCRRVTCASAFD